MLSATIFIFIIQITISRSELTDPSLHCQCMGKCTEPLSTYYILTTSYDKCLNNCKRDKTCQWITYDEDSGICEIFDDCFEIEMMDCLNCKTSFKTCSTQPDCYIKGTCQVSADKEAY